MDQPFKTVNLWFTSAVCQGEGPPEHILIPQARFPDDTRHSAAPPPEAEASSRLSLLGEACRNAPQTSGSGHPQAASPGSPASCSTLEARFSLPSPGLPKPASCLPWQRGQHTISKKHKRKMRTQRAWPGLMVLALERSVFPIRETENQDRWILS